MADLSGAEPSCPAAARRTALLVLTRDPTGRRSGRISVLETAAHSLETAGISVVAVVLSRQAPPSSWNGRPVSHVPLPALPRVAARASGTLVRRRGTLNEALFDSPDVRRRVRNAAWSSGACIVVADGLRTAGPALATDLPVVLHLDDLLSDRYAAMTADSRHAHGDLLGFFAEQLPPFVRGPAAALAARLIAVEARLADRRERELVRQVAALAMTSAAEAELLSRRTGHDVSSLPMAVDARTPGDPAGADANSFVFLGLLDYPPNRAALRWWVRKVRPALDERGGQDVRLTVIGHSSKTDDEFVGDPRVHLPGYVDDLGAELRRHRAMVAPIRTGAGVKTKILDGWSVGLPVVTTVAGAAGLDPGAGLLLADTPESFAAEVIRLRDDGNTAAAVGRAGREVLRNSWSSEALALAWAEVVLPLLPRME